MTVLGFEETFLLKKGESLQAYEFKMALGDKEVKIKDVYVKEKTVFFGLDLKKVASDSFMPAVGFLDIES